MAADAVDDGAGLDELGTVIVYLPRRRSAAEDRLVSALADRGRAVVVEMPADEDAVAAAAPRLVAAPDPEDEARAALRRLLVHAEAGTPLGRMAILYPVAEPYARLVPELLAGAAVPWNGPSPERLADSVAGRVVVGVVDLVAAGFPRDEVASWLASRPHPRRRRPTRPRGPLGRDLPPPRAWSPAPTSGSSGSPATPTVSTGSSPRPGATTTSPTGGSDASNAMSSRPHACRRSSPSWSPRAQPPAAPTWADLSGWAEAGCSPAISAAKDTAATGPTETSRRRDASSSPSTSWPCSTSSAVPSTWPASGSRSPAHSTRRLRTSAGSGRGSSWARSTPRSAPTSTWSRSSAAPRVPCRLAAARTRSSPTPTGAPPGCRRPPSAGPRSVATTSPRSPEPSR